MKFFNIESDKFGYIFYLSKNKISTSNEVSKEIKKKILITKKRKKSPLLQRKIVSLSKHLPLGCVVMWNSFESTDSILDR